jgi:hypothetical protein
MNLAPITIVGNLASEPESQTMADGRLRTRFRAAASSRTVDPQTGRWRDGETTDDDVVDDDAPNALIALAPLKWAGPAARRPAHFVRHAALRRPTRSSRAGR